MVLRDIPDEVKRADFFNNLRLEILASSCLISCAVLRDIPNAENTAGLFKNLRLEIFASPCLIS